VTGVKASTAVLMACLVGVSADAATPDTTGVIRVRVVSPRVLSSAATVQLTSVNAAFSQTAELRDSEAVAQFPRLLPGVYRLTARLQGFGDAETNVTVAPGSLTDLEVEFCEATAVCPKSVTRVTHTESVGHGYDFDRATLASFPGDDAAASVVETTIASMIGDRMSTGGLWAGEASLIGGPGSSWRQTQLRLGDVDVTDPVRIGTSLLRPHPEAFEALHVLTAMLPSSLSGPGPVLTLIPRMPSRIWQGAAAFDAGPSALQSDNAKPGAPSIAQFAMHREQTAQIGGAVGRQAGLFLSTHRAATDRMERGDPLRLRTAVNSFFVSSAINAGEGNRLRVVSTIDHTTVPYPGRARLPNRDVGETDDFATAQLTWDRATSGGHAWSVSTAFSRGEFGPELDLTSGDPHTVGAVVERLRDGPVPSLFEVFPGTRGTFSASIDFEPAGLFGTRWHSPAVGGAFARNTSQMRVGASPAVAEMVNGIPARIWEYRSAGSDSHSASTDLSAYITDRISLPARIRVDAGARIESTRGAARDSTQSIAWTSLVPRLGVNWIVDSRERLRVFGGAARYMHRLPLDYFSFGDPSALAGQVYRWNDVNVDGQFQSGERGVLIAAVGPCCGGGSTNQIDPDLKRPHTDELVAGINARLGDWSLRVVGIQRRQHDLIASVNTGVTANDYVVRTIADVGEGFDDPGDDRRLIVYDRTPSSFGQDRYLLTNPDRHSGYYKSVEVTLEGKIAAAVRTRFDGSAYHAAALGANRGFAPNENDPGVIGELFENPNATTYARGHPFSDRGYVMKWWGQYIAPRNYLFDVAARYQDGQPFSRLVVVPDLNQGAEAISAYRSGRTRFTFTLSVDARIQKSFRVGRTKITGVLTVFNALNTSNEVEEDVVTVPSFRIPTLVQPPRATHVGVRIGF